MPRPNNNMINQSNNQPPLPPQSHASMETDLGNLALTGMNQPGNSGSQHASPVGHTQAEVPIIDVFGNTPGTVSYTHLTLPTNREV